MMVAVTRQLFPKIVGAGVGVNLLPSPDDLCPQVDTYLLAIYR